MTDNDQKTVTSALEKISKAKESLQSGDRQAAWDFYHQVCMALLPRKKGDREDALFIKACLDLSQLGFILGKNFYELTLFLSKALEKAESAGDRRSWALINLHLGRLYYFSQRRHEASESFEKGVREVEALGDRDIITRSAEFMGLFYFTLGLLKEASHYFEIGLESYEADKPQRLIDVSSPMWSGYCAAYMGKFSQAIGTLDYYRRFAIEKKDRSSAAILRSVLGIVLLIAKKKQDAHHHLRIAKQEAKACGNSLALYFARGGLSYIVFDSGQINEARVLSEQLLESAKKMGLRRQYASPIFLEMFYSSHRAGLPSLDGISFPEEAERLLDEPNILMRGVALRLRALLRIEVEEQFASGKADLEKSQEYLLRTGASIQLAKTQIELARLALIEGDSHKARQYANSASKEMGGHIKEFYPDDLQFLLRSPGEKDKNLDSGKALLMRFMDVIQMLEPDTDFDLILNRIVKSVNRLLGAERGGVIWFGKTAGKAPSLKAAHNLTQADLQTPEFRSNLSAVFETYRTGHPQLIHNQKGELKEWVYQGRSMICIPITVTGETQGVLYYDNSYVDNCFEMLNVENLSEISLQLSSFIERLYLLFKKFHKQESHAGLSEPPPKPHRIITQCPAVEDIIAQAKRVAKTDSSILILGETGVGKEMFARYIHMKSLRADKPFIVIDPSTMPENLVESELFGHEKGAFTGADRQRRGRLEAAHNGTLFIDEVGDIPLSIQVKLLRTLQEKTFTRVGGTKEMASDFRLVAATHRNLPQMVSEGSFREDLFYRINVVPITIPPLRGRKEDIPILARHFLRQYALKYHNEVPPLSKTNEAVLSLYHWPGNIRELKNVMERTVLLSLEDKLEFNLPQSKPPKGMGPFEDLPTMEEIQKRYILYVLEKTGGRQSGPEGAAQILGMKRSTLYNRMKKLGILPG